MPKCRWRGCAQWCPDLIATPCWRKTKKKERKKDAFQSYGNCSEYENKVFVQQKKKKCMLKPAGQEKLQCL